MRLFSRIYLAASIKRIQRTGHLYLDWRAYYYTRCPRRHLHEPDIEEAFFQRIARTSSSRNSTSIEGARRRMRSASYGTRGDLYARVGAKGMDSRSGLISLPLDVHTAGIKRSFPRCHLISESRARAVDLAGFPSSRAFYRRAREKESESERERGAGRKSGLRSLHRRAKVRAVYANKVRARRVVRPRAPPTKMPGFLQPLAARDALGRSPLVFPPFPSSSFPSIFRENANAAFTFGSANRRMNGVLGCNSRYALEQEKFQGKSEIIRRATKNGRNAVTR